MCVKFTKPVAFAAALLFLVILEAGLLAWRHVGITPSTAPVFYWKGAPLVSTAQSSFGKALEMYRADRGAEQIKDLPAGRNMTIFYFEWDKIDFGYHVDLAGHEAETCNVEFGSFKLLQRRRQAIYKASNGETLDFNFTILADPSGKPTYVYKIPWVQGFGAWVGRNGGGRLTRLRLSFLRHKGAGRVLEAGIFGAASEDEAWSLFQHEVLDKLVWADS